MSELSKLTKSETELLGELLSGKNKAIEISIPDDLPAKTVVKYAHNASSLLHKNEAEKGILIAVLGRLHFLARTRPDVLKAADCQTIKDFEEKVAGSGAARSSIWAASAAYKAFPDLAPNDYAEIGSTNLAIASRAFKNASEGQKKEALEKAADLSTEQFREWVETKSGVSGPGETQAASFNLFGSKAEIDELKTWLADRAFREWAKAKDDSPIGMILAAIHEATTQFEDEEHQPNGSVQPGPVDDNNPRVDW